MAQLEKAIIIGKFLRFVENWGHGLHESWELLSVIGKIYFLADISFNVCRYFRFGGPVWWHFISPLVQCCLQNQLNEFFLVILFYNLVPSVVSVAYKNCKNDRIHMEARQRVCFWISREVWLGERTSGVGTIEASDFFLSTSIWIVCPLKESTLCIFRKHIIQADHFRI